MSLKINLYLLFFLFASLLSLAQEVKIKGIKIITSSLFNENLSDSTMIFYLDDMTIYKQFTHSSSTTFNIDPNSGEPNQGESFIKEIAEFYTFPKGSKSGLKFEGDSVKEGNIVLDTFIKYHFGQINSNPIAVNKDSFQLKTYQSVDYDKIDSYTPKILLKNGNITLDSMVLCFGRRFNNLNYSLGYYGDTALHLKLERISLQYSVDGSSEKKIKNNRFEFFIELQKVYPHEIVEAEKYYVLTKKYFEDTITNLTPLPKQ